MKFNLPDLGEGLPDAEINQWHVKEGEHIKIDAPLISMETAKAVVDVPSPFEGIIKKLHGKVGDVIKTGAVLVEFESEIEDTGTVAGKIEVGNQVVTEIATSVSKHSTGVKATPAVRAMAQRMGVDLNLVTPSGPNGTITREDLEKANEAMTQMGALEPLRGVRRAMAQTMSLSHAEVVPVTVMDDADVSAWGPTEDITARLIQAIVAAAQKEPSLNAWYDSKAAGRRIAKTVDLGLAMDTSDGLFVPVIRDAGAKSPQELRAKIETYKDQVNARSVPPEDLRNPTFTLSNYGKFAGRYASPIVVPPMVAILAVGKIREEAGVKQGQLCVCRKLSLSLTFDHRAVTGGEATRFLGILIESLQK